MKRDLIVSCIVAVAVHIFVLSSQLPGADNRNALLPSPISVSIIAPKNSVGSPPPVVGPPKTGVNPHSPQKAQALPRQTVIKRKKVSQKKTGAKPVAEKRQIRVSRSEEITEDRPPKTVTGTAVTSTNELRSKPPETLDSRVTDEGTGAESSLKTASTRHEHSIPGTRRESASGEGSTTYATPRYKDNPTPNYPRIAKARGYEGLTVLRVEVLETGKVGRLGVATSSGFKVLDRAALQSVQDWTFVPAIKNGARTRQWVKVPIRFCLE